MIRNLTTRSRTRRPGKLLGSFLRSEDGSFSIEAVIWMPIFAMLLAVIMNVSMVFFGESQMLRVVQDANRAFSLGRLADAEAVEQFVLTNLAYMDSTLTVKTLISGGIVSTELRAPATDLMPLNFMTAAFKNVNVAVNAQQIIEF